MRSWVFRHRRRLEVLYGAAPAQPEGAEARSPDARVAEGAPTRLRVLTLQPHPRRPVRRAG